MHLHEIIENLEGTPAYQNVNYVFMEFYYCISTKCVSFQKDKRIIHIFLAGYSISIIFLVISLIVFVCFR